MHAHVTMIRARSLMRGPGPNAIIKRAVRRMHRTARQSLVAAAEQTQQIQEHIHEIKIQIQRAYD